MELNKIYNEDCLSGMKRIPDNSIDLIVTDPPYFQGLTHNGQKGSFVDLAVSRPFFEALFQEYKRVLKPDACVFFFCDWRGYAFYYPIFDAILGASNLLVWDKISAPGSKYSYSHELLIFHAPVSVNKGGSSIFRVPGFSSGAKKIEGEKVHPTQKPLALIKQLVADHSKVGDLVLDTFMGSGTTAIACRELGRNFIGYELDIKNFSIAQKRVFNA
ncbi:DNA-methyltransferase [Chitinophaga ginsengisegetis]|uniref:DNA-methyltransferase n=1 Tax=Chitinophaga ginsengisegetis TaxID=393003 RepID=UPI000DBA5EE6|nr:site-specific DNA-methyltransferase [Chitinophaga ginsengisegetis]MDR6565471.1 site-specific DNA-methyltransferase (adenine-specific) [Chitinophaga ginsengisegetis]MDR6645199.1 site-specific DNA-methyltransferase (adenine-specific) [Chitinophaga ginsengisegetis]MDR6652209.1 site-specific DNA-methyltransferase (adenine-specific) [Chitinophaga ginsengisegetis]